jgi:predicted DCC family thiol-disulfide oxidoreductase YuxK
MSDAPPPPTQGKPLLIYDGECGFCRRWVDRGRSLTGDRVDYAPSQEVAAQFPQIAQEQFKDAAWLSCQMARRHMRRPSFAGLRKPRSGLDVWAYEHVPGFAGAQAGYRWVARHRPFLSKVTHVLYGQQTLRPTYKSATQIFLRLVGMVYLIAFWSAWSQVPGLLGRDGILPADDFLQAVREHLGVERFWRVPTLCWWIGASDSILSGFCGAGVLVSILVVLGIAQGACLVALWAMYLSFTSVGQDFFSFQWDTLLLETGLLAIFVAPWRIRSWRGPEPVPSTAFIWLLHILLFKLMFLSGATKLSYGDATWHNLTAITYYYETQPLPTWIGWYAHQLPRWFQQVSCAIMFFIELGLPFFIFGARRLKQIAFAGFLFLQVLIALTGNYNFFNLLTIALCVMLLDDALLARRSGDPSESTSIPTFVYRPVWRRAIIALVVLFYVSVSAVEGYEEIVGRSSLPASLSTALSHVRSFRSINGYGLFRVMTTSRPEIVLEGSDDGQEWIEYEFPFKAGDLKKPPAFVEPHQPRLDWQMWFAALAAPRYPVWFVRFVQRLLEGSPAVKSLFARTPFPDHPPAYLRAILYQYRFTTREERSATGEWWHREKMGLYLVRVSLKPRE